MKVLAALEEEKKNKVKCIINDKPNLLKREKYNFCIKKSESVLAIGDNIRTDIKGANIMNFDSLFIIEGIHKKEFLNLSMEKYDQILKKYNTKTNYYQERLSW